MIKIGMYLHVNVLAMSLRHKKSPSFGTVAYCMQVHFTLWRGKAIHTHIGLARYITYLAIILG